MKILHITFEDIRKPTGGLGVHVANLAIEQAKMGDEVWAFGFDPINHDFFFGDWNGIKVLNCLNTTDQSLQMGAYYMLQRLNVMLCENFMKHLIHEKFDIIHLHDTSLWLIGKAIAIANRCPIVLTTHLSHSLTTPYPKDAFSQMHWTWETQNELNAHSHCHADITVTKTYARKLKESLISQNEIKVIPNGINFEELQKYSYDKDINQEYGQGKLVVGFVGRFVENKGLALIRDAIKVFPRKYHFVLISFFSRDFEGKNDWVDIYEDLADEYDNFTWIKDWDSTDERKWQLMVSCDLAIVPSLVEPYGIVSDEWASLQVPKIVTNVDGLPEHNDESDSVMIEPNSESLIKALENFKLNPEKVDTAWKRARENKWSDVANKTKEVYLSCLKS